MAALFLALALTCFAGWQFKAHCVGGGVWLNHVQYTSGCYSDAVPFWGSRGVAAGEIPYLQARLEYPVLTGGLIWIEGQATRALFGAQANAADFLHVVTLFNALLAALVLWLFCRARMSRGRLWAWALAPPLVLYVGHNWDLLAIALTVAALLQARAGKQVRSAALAALGVAAKLFPVLLLPLLGLDALFGPSQPWRRRIVGAALVSLAAVAAWALVNVPVALAAFTNWWEFYAFSSQRGGTAASIWEVLAWFGWPTDVPTRNLFAALLFLAGAALIVALGWRRHRDRLWVLFTPLLAWFMLTNKVYSPQFDLWLYPMLLMTLRRPGPIALFVAADITAYFAEFWMFAGLEGASPSATVAQVAGAALVRAFAMLWSIQAALTQPPPDWLLAEPEPNKT